MDSSHSFAPTRSLTPFAVSRCTLQPCCQPTGRSAAACMAQSTRGHPETITVLGKSPVRVFYIVICPERARNLHVRHKALHDAKNDGCALAPSSVRSLEAGGAIHEHEYIPQALEEFLMRSRRVDMNQFHWRSHPCRRVVRSGMAAWIPSACKHPEYEDNLPTKQIPCCCAVAFRTPT